jgi:hypothetical protein
MLFEYEGFLKDILGGLAAIGFLGWGIYLVASFLRRRQQDAMQKHLLEKFASAQDFATFVQSPAGQKYVMNLSSAVTSPRNSILSSVRTGIVLMFLGVGFANVSVTNHANEWLHSLGSVVLLLGLGFLFAGVAAHFLAKKIRNGEKEL